jgi:hypothetical protein
MGDAWQSVILRQNEWTLCRWRIGSSRRLRGDDRQVKGRAVAMRVCGPYDDSGYLAADV